MRNTRNSFFVSVIALILCFVMLAGSTFAWFTDVAISSGNVIQSGNLDIALMKGEPNDNGGWDWVENNGEAIFDYDKWEPGYTTTAVLAVENHGSLSAKWTAKIELDGTPTILADVIDIYVTSYHNYSTSRPDFNDGTWQKLGTVREVLDNDGLLLPGGTIDPGHRQPILVALNMRTDAGNDYQDMDLGANFNIKILATQASVESDSYDNTYDEGAEWPELPSQGTVATTPITLNGDGTLATEATMANPAGNITATLPAGVKFEQGTTSAGLSVNQMQTSGANITVSENEETRSYDVHIGKIAADNTIPVAIKINEFLPAGLNIGNYSLYHVEDGQTVLMTLLTAGATPVHNNFEYDPATGDVTMYLASFSEIALVAEAPKWEGNFDYNWYDANATELTIANADQLAAFGAIVGGMAKMEGENIYTSTGVDVNATIVQDSFSGKTVKLLSDINLGDKEAENNPDLIFYPIGYWNSEESYVKNTAAAKEALSSGFYNFCGTFDGNGHTVSNFYQNTWEMKGDHNWYDPIKEQYYRDGMGLFGKVYGGTVKNLTVKNFSSDGEIATTGVIAAYADGATFENIAIFNCNPRVYNIGNGGIVGCVGWYAKEANLKTTFKNITVDNSNKISALWGSYDVACGGIVGQYYPTSGQSSVGYPVNGGISFENCHISAQMDVYNDVCANYQYYAYRYTGMLIGSVRENETINGHSYPKMEGITAENCTVHFGDWNDYYYCEIVANSLASYTHDHQFSRLTQVKAINGTTITYLDGTTGTVPSSGWAHYVVVKNKDNTTGKWIHGDGSDYATCYHFNNGEVWTHDKAGTETVNGVEGVLKEDKQLVYLEFNNLVTGYGWGVTSRGFHNLDGVTNLDISTGHEESVKKFESTVTELANSKEYKLGDIFSFVDKGVELVPGALTVSVHNIDKNNPVSATIVYDRTNWENGTITLSGAGDVQITIQDYYFCTPTTITVNVTDRQPEIKFENKFNNSNFTYRIGNAIGSTVALSTLFNGTNVTNGNVTVAFETISGNATGSYTADKADWTKGTIQFSGTGKVKVTITDNDYCVATELTLEVVEAVNATGAMNATSNNVVLLNNAGFSSLEVSGGYTLYGNGFTLTCGSDSAALDMGYAFVNLDNGTLDNVQIVLPNFDHAVLYKSNMTESANRKETTDKTRYFNVKSGVMVSGNSQILNSRISGARAAVNVTAGNCLIENSRLEGGAVASLLIGSANSVTLRDITLVQKPTASTYDSSKVLMGFSVLVVCDSEGNSTPITLEGTLVQNAWVDENDKQYVPSAGQSIVENAMAQTEYLHDLDGDGTNESLNLGFAYMPESFDKKVNTTTITDNRTNKEGVPYDYAKVSMGGSGNNTYVFSYKNTNGTADSFKNVDDYEPNKYSDIITVTYSDTADGLEMGKSFGTSGWVYELNVDLDTLSGYALDFSKISMSVNGVSVTDYKVNGNSKPISPVSVVAGGVTYTLTATVNGKECTANLKVIGTETTKESPSLIASNYQAALLVGEAGSTLSKDTWHGAAPVLGGIQIKYWSVAEKQYKTINLSDYTPTTAGKQNGSNTTWTYTPANGDFTLTITGGQVHSSNKVSAIPVVCNGKLYFVAATSSGLVNYGNSARTIPVSYSFKDNNGGTELTFSHTWSIECANGNTAYDYSDFMNGTSKTFTIKSSNGNVCVTPDTLVTLADGSQKRIDQVTYEDQLLVWNFFTGEYDVVPSAIIFYHGNDMRRVLKLNFEDGTSVKVITNHGFFDVELNQFVFIDENNVDDLIGHHYVKVDGDDHTAVKLVGYEVFEEYTGSYSIQSAMHNNFMVEGMFSITMPHYEGWFDYFEIGEGMKYDEKKMYADIEQYGLYTYEDFADYVTYEQFIAFNGPYLKVLVGRGVVTYEQIIELIDMYVNPEN